MDNITKYGDDTRTPRRTYRDVYPFVVGKRLFLVCPPSITGSSEVVNGLGLSDTPYLPQASKSSDRTAETQTKRITFDPQKHLSEVCGIEIYLSSVVVIRQPTIKPDPREFERGEITELSDKSLARLAFVAFNTEVDFKSIITLTYPDIPDDGKQVKKDLNRLLEWYRAHFPGEKYLWFLEFQKRGSVHFHILSTVDLAQLGKLSEIKRNNGKKWLTHYETWQKLEQYWQKRGGGFTSWEVVREKDGGKRYAAKYATKTYQKAVPVRYRGVGRFWGYSREGVKPEPKASYECSEDQLREALKNGGWEYTPKEGAMMHKELYQAAEKIDLSGLDDTQGCPSWKWDGELRMMGQFAEAEIVTTGPIFTDRPNRTPLKLEYMCLECGEKAKKWAGQCPSCNEWDALKGFPVEPNAP